MAVWSHSHGLWGPQVNVALCWAFPLPSDFSWFPKRRCPALLLFWWWHCPCQSPWWVGVWLCVGLHCTRMSYSFPMRAPCLSQLLVVSPSRAGLNWIYMLNISHDANVVEPSWVDCSIWIKPAVASGALSVWYKSPRLNFHFSLHNYIDSSFPSHNYFIRLFGAIWRQSVNNCCLISIIACVHLDFDWLILNIDEILNAPNILILCLFLMYLERLANFDVIIIIVLY